MVLELTLKHVKALTALIEQQQQKIVALQSGFQAGECLRPATSLESPGARGLGLHTCCKKHPCSERPVRICWGRRRLIIPERSDFSFGTPLWAAWQEDLLVR